MRLVIALAFFAQLGLAQTNVWLRAGGPQAQVVTGCTNASPMVCTTQQPHGLSSSCTLLAPCVVQIGGVPCGTGACTANGNRQAVYIDATHLALYDAVSGSPVAANGNWWSGATVYPNQNTSAQWLAPATQFVIPANPGPLGVFDGSNGDLIHSISTGPANGLTSIVVSGCSGGNNCVITTTVTYNPLTMKFPVTAGQYFSVTGSGSSSLDQCGGGVKSAGAQSPYTIASVSSTGWVSAPFTCAGLSNGDYTNNNLHCGPNATPNWTIGGTLPCVRTSLIAHTASPAWNYVVSQRRSSCYKTFFDGGCYSATSGTNSLYTYAAYSFLVDPTNLTWLQELQYGINYDFRTGGTGYHGNTAFWGQHQNEAYGEYDGADPEALAIMYAVAFHAPEGAYGAASDQTAFLNRTYNDLDDPTVSTCTLTNQDIGNQSNHNWVLSSGLLGVGTNDSTHAQLPVSDPCYNGSCYGGTGYTNTVIALYNGSGINFDSVTRGVITTHSSSGLLTINNSTGSIYSFTVTNGGSGYSSGTTSVAITSSSGGSGATAAATVNGSGVVTAISITGGNKGSGYLASTTTVTITSTSGGTGVTATATINSWGGSAIPPALNNVVSATYNASGSTLTVTGSTGQVAALEFGTNSNSTGLITLTGTNAVTNGETIQVWWPGTFGSAPTTAKNQSNGISSVPITGTANVTTTLGTAYTIFDTALTSNATGSSSGSIQTATITLTKTGSLTGTINPGDGFMASNTASTPSFGMSYVTAVSGGSTMSVTNGASPTASTSAYQIAWRFPQFQTGDCGRIWVSRRQETKSWGSSGAVYGGGAANDAAMTNAGQKVISDTAANGGGSPPMDWFVLDLATAVDEPRAIRDLARQSAMFDFGIRPVMTSMGRQRDGPAYSYDVVYQAASAYMFAANNTIPSYPSLYGDWAAAVPVWYMYDTLPQLSGGAGLKAGWAGAAGYGNGNTLVCPGCQTQDGVINAIPLYAAPTSNTAKWIKDFGENFSTDGSMYGRDFLMDDYRVTSAPYTQQPLQYTTSRLTSNVTATTGWPDLWTSDAVISRTCWQCASGSLLMFDNATFSGDSGPYDAPRLGNLSFWKGGGVLLGGDQNPSNTWWTNNPAQQGDTFSFNNGGYYFFNGIQGSIGITPMPYWSSQYAGTYGTSYGDANSTYAAGCGNNTAGYSVSTLGINLDHVIRCFAHLKKSGYDEFIFQYDDAALATGSPLPMGFRLQYVQNGQTQTGFGGYHTGSTTLSGSLITSLEDGASGRTYGLETEVFSPGTITLTDLCIGHGGGQCAPGDTYPGGLGNTHAFEVSGGASTSAAVSSFSALTVHKVMQNLTDSTFTAAAINPDSNWTGAQANGSFSCAVVLQARNNVLQGTMAPFTPPSTSGVCTTNVQYLFEGVSAGVYNIAIGGTPVSGSPFNVASGDNSIEFITSLTGTVNLNASAFTVPPSAGLSGVYLSGLYMSNFGLPLTNGLSWSTITGTLWSNITSSQWYGIIP